MYVAITQRETNINGFKYDCLSNDWYNLFKTYKIHPIPNLGSYSLNGIDFLILSGGDDSENRRSTETYCVNQAIKRNIPVIGICHGAFFLNDYFNGTNGTIPNHRDTQHEIIMDNSIHTVNSYHNLSIDTLGDDLIPAATTIHNDIEGFRHKTLNIWGIVWHPERMKTPILPAELKRLLCLNY